jgi:hypothetical protein
MSTGMGSTSPIHTVLTHHQLAAATRLFQQMTAKRRMLLSSQPTTLVSKTMLMTTVQALHQGKMRTTLKDLNSQLVAKQSSIMAAAAFQMKLKLKLHQKSALIQ